MKDELNKLIKFISENLVFDEKAYPELKNVDEEKRLLFALKHSALHFSKTAGKIAEVNERIDHGKEANSDELKSNVSKALINTLRLAELVGITGDDLIQAIENKYNKKLPG